MSRFEDFSDEEIYLLGAIFDVAVDDPEPLLAAGRDRIRALMVECGTEQLRRDGELSEARGLGA